MFLMHEWLKKNKKAQCKQKYFSLHKCTEKYFVNKHISVKAEWIYTQITNTSVLST